MIATVTRLKSLPSYRQITVVAVLILFGWFAFVATQYTRHRIHMRSIARELYMEYRAFHVVADPLEPLTSVDGEERLLVVGESSENFLLCSIVRNPLYNDFRGRWKVDQVFRPDRQPEHPRLPIWEPLDHFPTELDVKQFRSRALKEPWVTWDRPEGTDP